MKNSSIPKSKLVKNQKKTINKVIVYDGEKCDLIVTIRHDDDCSNGHNSFAITGDVYRHGKARTDRNFLTGGCIHEVIAEHMPELKNAIQYHLTSTDEPLHYVANSLYHAETSNLEMARSSAIWPDAKLKDFTKASLLKRLPALMQEFKTTVESFGLEY